MILKGKLKWCMLFVLILSAFLCFYSIKNYKGSTTASKGNITQHNFQGNGNNNMGGRGQNSKDSRPSINQHSGNNSSDRSMPGGNIQGRNISGSSLSNSNTYSMPLILSEIIFLIFFVIAYYLMRYNKININSNNIKILLITILGAGLLLRIAGSLLMEGFSSDMSLFKSWAVSAANDLKGFYIKSKSSDYPPFYIYILALVGKAATVHGLSNYFTLLLKLPSIIADIVSSYLIYRLSSKYLSSGTSILLCTFYCFNPAVFLNSTFWGQVDSFFTLLVLIGVAMISEKKICISSVFFTLAVLMKPQGIIFLPVLFFELVRRKKIRDFAAAAVSCIITALVVILPFSFSQSPLWIFKLYLSTVGEYPYASVNAFNFFSLLGANYAADTSKFLLLSYHTWGMIFIIAVTFAAWFIYIKGHSIKFAPAVSLILIAGVFTFSTSMHERYLFPAASLALLSYIYLKDRRILLVFAGYSATIFINTHYVLFTALNNMGSMGVPINSALIFTSLLNVILFIYLLKVMYDIALKKKVLPI